MLSRTNQFTTLRPGCTLEAYRFSSAVLSWWKHPQELLHCQETWRPCDKAGADLDFNRPLFMHMITYSHDETPTRFLSVSSEREELCAHDILTVFLSPKGHHRASTGYESIGNHIQKLLMTSREPPEDPRWSIPTTHAFAKSRVSPMITFFSTYIKRQVDHFKRQGFAKWMLF